MKTCVADCATNIYLQTFVRHLSRMYPFLIRIQPRILSLCLRAGLASHEFVYKPRCLSSRSVFSFFSEHICNFEEVVSVVQLKGRLGVYDGWMLSQQELRWWWVGVLWDAAGYVCRWVARAWRWGNTRLPLWLLSCLLAASVAASCACVPICSVCGQPAAILSSPPVRRGLPLVGFVPVCLAALSCLGLLCVAFPWPALACLSLPCLTLCCLVRPCLALPRLVRSSRARPYLVPPWLALSCRAMPCHALPSLALPFFAVPCLVLSCLV